MYTGNLPYVHLGNTVTSLSCINRFVLYIKSSYATFARFFTFYFKDGFTCWILESRYKESTTVTKTLYCWINRFETSFCNTVGKRHKLLKHRSQRHLASFKFSGLPISHVRAANWVTRLWGYKNEQTNRRTFPRHKWSRNIIRKKLIFPSSKVSSFFLCFSLRICNKRLG